MIQNSASMLVYRAKSMSELQIKTFNLGELQTNCYIAWCSDTNAAVVIDPADSGDVLSEFLLEQQLQLEVILLTHGHFDHCLGLLELSLNFAVPSFLHPADLFLIKGAQKSAEHWLKHSVDPVPTPTNNLHESTLISFGNCSLKVLETPGHTPGSVCFVSELARYLQTAGSTSDTKSPLQENNSNMPATPQNIFVDGLQVYPGTGVIFTGDTLFKDSFPRTDFRYSSVLDLRDSWGKLKKLEPETTILPGHGDLTRLGATALYL